jgi:hypothetical protein
MTAVELITLRSALVLRRAALIDRLATDESGSIEPGFLRLLADTHTAIAALDAALADTTEPEGDAPCPTPTTRPC